MLHFLEHLLVYWVRFFDQKYGLLLLLKSIALERLGLLAAWQDEVFATVVSFVTFLCKIAFFGDAEVGDTTVWKETRLRW